MSILAINGGEKAVNIDQDDALLWPLVTDEDKAKVLEVLEMSAGVAGEGWYGEAYKFEEEVAEYLGIRYALAHNSGTSAIHAALFAIGLTPGDEVIVPSYTFWATCMPVLCCGAIPVFAEVDPKSATIDPRDIETKVTSRTKAIIVVHLWGRPCEMEATQDVADKHNLKIIEDAAQAHGAEYRDSKVGTIGDIGCFSFQSSKNLPTIEGGILVTNEEEYYERAIALGHYERIKTLPDNSVYRKYEATCLGHKHRMHPLSAALGRVQLKHLDQRNEIRSANIEYVNDRLRGLPGIDVFDTPSHMKRIYYQYEIVYNDAEATIDKHRFVQALQAEGVRAGGERYPLQHQQPVYKERGLNPPDSMPVSEKLRDSIIALPTFPRATRPLLDQYVEAFKKVAANTDEL